jgi:hypothetical protein
LLRNFIKKYSEIVLSLIHLTQKHCSFAWISEVPKAFLALKEAFTSALVLAHVNSTQLFIIEADTSDFAVGSILSQLEEDRKLHPIAFYSQKFNAKKINYDVHNKELLAIVDSFGQWRQFLEGSPHQVIVYNDHKILIYFQTT